ncbi:MAG: T9SS type A sorting domain-containing protein [Melioribacteraceae bacterium]|nr:T9SS type A sorting domain-containing protein [Melioribacteraceae bacterium]
MFKLIRLFLIVLPVITLRGQIQFSAEIESGNLGYVSIIDSATFTVHAAKELMRHNNSMHSRWFYFKITGVKDRQIKLVLEDTDVNRPFYSYNNLDFIRINSSEAISSNSFQKVFEEDTVYLAYYVPYTFSYLQTRITEWSASPYVKIDTLGYSPNNLPLQMLTITDRSESDENKKQVWIHSRTHPGETPSSFHFDGIVQTLTDYNDVMQWYRENIVFYLVPFNNPEGVLFGRSRTNIYDTDQEREWNKPDSNTAPEVLILKNKLAEICNKKPVDVFLNLHSQASPYCTFWIHTSSSTSGYFYRREMQFSNLNVSDNPYFNLDDLRFSDLQNYFPEGWLWNNYGDAVMALTYETPYDKYSGGEWVDNESLYEIGRRTVYAVSEYLELSHPKHLILDNNSAIVTGTWKTAEFGTDFYSDNFLYNEDGNGSVKFEADEMPDGVYDVYAWWVESNGNSYSTEYRIISGHKVNAIEKTQTTNGSQWNYISEIEIRNGSVSVEIAANNTGIVVADAVRLIYRSPLTDVKQTPSAYNFKLYQNYPNPFNPSTTIRFQIDKPAHVSLKIFNSIGELVQEIVNEYLSIGNHEYIFNAFEVAGISSGVYYYTLRVDNYSMTKPMMLVK